MSSLVMDRYVAQHRRYQYDNFNKSGSGYKRAAETKSRPDAPYITLGNVVFVLCECHWLEAVVIREFQDHLYIHYVDSGKGCWINRFSRRLMLSKNQNFWAGHLRGVQWTLPEDVASIQRLLKLGCDINLRSANPITNPLCVAIERGWSYETIELLLDCHADLFSRNPFNNQTPLWSLQAQETDDTLRGEATKPLMDLAWLLISRGAWSDLMVLNTLGETLAEKLHGDLSKFIQLCTFRCLHFIDECVSIDIPKQHALPPSVSHIISSYIFDIYPYERYPLLNSGLHSEEQKEEYQLELLLGDEDEEEQERDFSDSPGSSPSSHSPISVSLGDSKNSPPKQTGGVQSSGQTSGQVSGRNSRNSRSSNNNNNMTCLRRMQLCRFSVECMEQDRIDDYLRALWFRTVYGS